MEPITEIPRNDQSFVPTIDPAAQPVEPPKSRFELRRSRTDRMLSGVCGGVAKAFGIDATLVRLGLVALTVLGAGAGVVVYAAAWILVPEEDVERSLAQDWTQNLAQNMTKN